MLLLNQFDCLDDDGVWSGFEMNGEKCIFPQLKLNSCKAFSCLSSDSVRSFDIRSGFLKFLTKNATLNLKNAIHDTNNVILFLHDLEQLKKDSTKIQILTSQYCAELDKCPKLKLRRIGTNCCIVRSGWSFMYLPLHCGVHVCTLRMFLNWYFVCTH